MRKTIKNLALLIMLAICVKNAQAQQQVKNVTALAYNLKDAVAKNYVKNTASTNSFLNSANVSSTLTIVDIPPIDKCSEWNPGGAAGPISLLFLKVCERKDGGGYFKIKNDNEKGVNLRYRIYFKNGGKDHGSAKIPAKSETIAIGCSDCVSKKGGGVSSFEFFDILFEGEKGY